MREANADKLMENLGRELLAYCLYKQGKFQEAIDSLAKQSTSGNNHESKIMIGQLLAKEGRWQEAVKTWAELKDQSSISKVQRRRLSDLLLMAAVKLSEKQDWGAAFHSISLAREIHTSNPLLEYLPEEESLPVLLYESGEYKNAAEIWERHLVEDEYSTELVHLLAIVYQCRLENEADASPSEKAEFLTKANMYWTALSQDESYWRQIYEKRRAAYNEQVALDSFLEMSRRLGVDRCDGKVQELGEGPGSEPDPQYANLVEQTIEAMAVERHSAKLIAQTQDQMIGIKGGLTLASLIHGAEDIKAMIKRSPAYSIGSPAWLLNRLISPNEKGVAVHYLNGDYHKCLELVDTLKSDDAFNLVGLAVIKMAESAAQAQIIKGTRWFAEKFGLIPDTDLRSQLARWVEKMAVAKGKMLIGKNQIDKAIEFLNEVQEKATSGPKGRMAPMGGVRSSLGEAYLKRAGMNLSPENIDKNLADYKKAKELGASFNNLDATLRTIIRAKVYPMINANNYREPYAYLSIIQKEGYNEPYLKALGNLILVLEAAQAGKNIGDDKFFQLAEEAHNIDPNESEFRTIYSMALTQKAVLIFQSAAQSVQVNPLGFITSLNTVEDMLNKALAIDGTNQAAMNNLLEVQKTRLQIGGAR